MNHKMTFMLAAKRARSQVVVIDSGKPHMQRNKLPLLSMNAQADPRKEKEHAESGGGWG